VVELVDAPDSKSGSERSVGSSSTARTTKQLTMDDMLGLDSLIAAMFLSCWNPGRTWQLVVLFGLCDAIAGAVGPSSILALGALGLVCSLKDWRLALPFILATDNAFAGAGPADAAWDGVTSATLAGIGFLLRPRLAAIGAVLGSGSVAASEG
jgi:hypothetical protein